MSGPHPSASRYDPETVRAKYLAERDKRLVPNRAEIRDQRSDERFARYRDDPFTPVIERDPVADDVDVVIVGGGIAGVLAGAHLRKAGLERIRIVDQAGGIGGTWYWNRYPGVMCDVESYTYLPMLDELDYIPTRRYAFGDEIRGHLEAIADRFDLVAGALFLTGATHAAWHEDEARWRIRTDRGDEVSCRWYVLAVGILNLMKLPTIPGLEDFAGHSFHTARWDYGYTGGGPDVPLTGLSDKVVG
ncbi:MAG: NAD(P)-binding protein, partial [Acidimicrobiales bacterium]